MERTLTYFVSDVHLGLDVKDKDGRERRFVDFLRTIPAPRTKALYLLGDIWDFWYEYRDVVPRGYVRVLGALAGLADAGVEVFFFRGNHDIWAYDYFSSLGIRYLEQPYLTQIGGKVFCLGHGDGLGPGMRRYRLMNRTFKNRFFQRLFSSLHPWLAYRLGNSWSKHSRLAKSEEYVFRGESEPLCVFAEQFGRERHVDCFIFGHYHTAVDMVLPCGSRFILLKDWMDSSPWLCYDEALMVFTSASGGSLPKMEK